MLLNPKTLLSLCILMCICTSTQADYFNDRYIVGASLVQQYADLRSDTNLTDSSSGSGVEIYLDKYVLHKYRLKSRLGYIKHSRFDVTELSLAADYLIPLQTSVSAFIGASAGMATQKYDNASFGDSATGGTYGVQFGTIKYLSNDYLLEFGLRLRRADIDTVINTTPQTTNTIDRLHEAYISVLFMF